MRRPRVQRRKSRPDDGGRATGGRFPRLLQAAIDAFSLPDLRAKILFTLAILALYRFIAHIPLPGIDQVQLDNLFRNNELLGSLICSAEAR